MTDDTKGKPQTPAKVAAYKDTLFEFPTERSEERRVGKEC